MCDALLGMCSQDIRDRIDRERRKSQQVADASIVTTGKTQGRGGDRKSKKPKVKPLSDEDFLPIKPTGKLVWGLSDEPPHDLIRKSMSEIKTDSDIDPQAVRAEKAGVCRETQNQLDAVARERPDLKAKVDKRELSADAPRPRVIRAECFGSLVAQYPDRLGGTADHVFGNFLLQKFGRLECGMVFAH